MANPPQPGEKAASAAKTLIDGYNLMYAAGISSRGTGLERSRVALLNFLAASLPSVDLPRTVVVFDANDAPRGLPRTVRHRGMWVHYASKHADADALIEELIAAHTAPRQLTVVSSDHRLHRAARRRRAKVVDSEVWFEELLRNRYGQAPTRRPAKPPTPLPSADVAYWLNEFGDAEVDNEVSSPFPPGHCDDLLDEET